MHSTLHLHIELYVCMYVFYCLLLWTVDTYFIWTVTLYVLWMNFGKDKCNIIWQATSILVLCSDTVKEPATVSSHIRVSKQTTLLHWNAFYYNSKFLSFVQRVDFDAIVEHLALTHIIKSKMELATGRIKRLLE